MATVEVMAGTMDEMMAVDWDDPQVGYWGQPWAEMMVSTRAVD